MIGNKDVIPIEEVKKLPGVADNIAKIEKRLGKPVTLQITPYLYSIYFGTRKVQTESNLEPHKVARFLALAAQVLTVATKPQNPTILAKWVKGVLEYESDTFSASGSKITPKEAAAVVESIIESYFENHLDGVTISNKLDELRGE